VKSSHRLAST